MRGGSQAKDKEEEEEEEEEAGRSSGKNWRRVRGKDEGWLV